MASTPQLAERDEQTKVDEGTAEVKQRTLLEEMAKTVARTPLQPCEVWIPEGQEIHAVDQPEFLEIEVVLDSGTGLHVGNRKHFPGYTVEANDLSKAGAGFVAADGGIIDNVGEVALEMTIKDGDGNEHEISSKFHIAEVARALWSVGVICDAGLEAKFSATAAVVQKKDGTPVCHFDRCKGLYIAKVRVKNPLHKGFQRRAP